MRSNNFASTFQPSAERQVQAENKDSQKAKKISVVFHIILLLAFLIPIVHHTMEDKPAYEQVVVIEFNDFKSAAEKSSTRKATPVTPVAEKPTPVPEEIIEKPVVEPQPKPVPTAPTKPVITTTKPAPPIKTAPTKAEKPIETPKTEKTPKTPPVVTPPKKEVPTKPTTPTTPTKAPAKETTKAEAPGKISEKGNGDTGSSTKGNADSDGKADKGDSGDDFSGDGLFTRKVVYRADVKKLTKKEGKIVINLCVNKDGKVIFTEFNTDLSTIKDKDLIKKAEKATANYRFEKDYTAPRKQCGKLAFVFEIDE